MMRPKGYGVIGLMAAAATLTVLTRPNVPGEAVVAAQGRGCSVATLRGAYGIQMQGTRPSGPGGPIESVNGLVMRVYDGDGQFTQVDTLKGAISGLTADREGAGTYEVNEDCTGTTTFEPGPGVLITERIVVVRGGAEVFSMVATPAPVMITTTQKRVSER